MVNALPNDFFLSLAARKKIWEKGAAARQALMREKRIKTPLTMPTGKALQYDIDNSLWTASTIALDWGEATRRSGKASCACCQPFPGSPSRIRRPAGSPR